MRAMPIKSFHVSRCEYDEIMTHFCQKADAARNRRVKASGDASFTKPEALAETLISFLTPQEKCRAVMEYDPAGERVRFFRERHPGGRGERDGQQRRRMDEWAMTDFMPLGEYFSKMEESGPPEKEQKRTVKEIAEIVVPVVVSIIASVATVLLLRG